MAYRHFRDNPKMTMEERIRDDARRTSDRLVSDLFGEVVRILTEGGVRLHEQVGHVVAEMPNGSHQPCNGIHALFAIQKAAEKELGARAENEAIETFLEKVNAIGAPPPARKRG